MGFREYIKNHCVVTDGAMGSYYAQLEKDDFAISEYANLREPGKIQNIHTQYIEAGAKLIRTNTFAANTKSLDITIEEQNQMLVAACELARQAVVQSGKEVFIAASIGPIPITGEEEEDQIENEYERMCEVFLQHKVDVLLFETFSEYKTILPVIETIRKKSDVFIQVNFCLDKNGYTKAGISAKRILVELSGIDAIDGCGFNCGVGSGHLLQIIKKTTITGNKYIAAIPNAGYPEQLQNRMVFLDNANYFSDNMEEIVKSGVHMIGGCCGTNPEYIRKIAHCTAYKQNPLHHRDTAQSVNDNITREQGSNEFYEKFHQGKKVVAVELDPPYDANYEKLIEMAEKLKKVGTDIITMADSPMGRSRVDSILMSIKIRQQVDIPVMPHVCCRDKNMIAMRSSLLGAYINDIRNLLIVTGDPVPSESRVNTSSVFDYNSIRLMEFVKEMNEEHFYEEPMYYGGALNYARGNVDKVIERMEKKIAAGTKFFLTQPAYSKEDIDRLRYIRSKVDTKILCGIMPFVSYRNANFVKNEFSGIHVPEEIVNRYSPEMSKEEAELVGAQIANELIEQMKDFADGYYFMLPFNRVSLMDKIKIQ